MPRCILKHRVSIIGYPGMKNAVFILLSLTSVCKISQSRFHVHNSILYLVYIWLKQHVDCAITVVV